MDFQEYKTYFEEIISKEIDEQSAPYDQSDYIDYTKLNWSRMNRWLKTGVLSEDVKETIRKIDQAQQWIVITEPWCGDAAHNIPFLELMAKENDKITISYVLRDTEPFLIDQYLTNGTKSIPKLIIRNADGKDLAVWGPRPEDCQKMYAGLINENADFEKIKIEIQSWYNANKGKDIQIEINELLKQISH